MKLFSGILLVAVCALVLSGEADADAGQMLQAHFDSVGGLDNLSAIKTVKRTGVVERNGSFGTSNGTIEEAIVVGKKSYSNVKLARGSEVRGWDGQSGWKRISKKAALDLKGAELYDAKVASYLDPLQGIYEERGAAAFKLRGELTVFGKICHSLAVVDTPIVFYLDKQTYQLVAKQTDYRLGDMVEGKAMIAYSDYLEIGGVKMPNKVHIVIGDGTNTVTYTYKSTDINNTIDETIFEIP